MKKSVIFAAVFSILILGVVVSAFSFSDLFKTTGKQVSASTYQITDATGICIPSGLISLNGTVINGAVASYAQSISCSQYTSSLSCSQDTNCFWSAGFSEFMTDTIHINQGWNLVDGLFLPNQISYGDAISPSNIKAIYGFDSVAKTYFSYLSDSGASLSLPPDLLPSSISALSPNQPSGYALNTEVVWIYSDMTGNIKYRTQPGYGLTGNKVGKTLITNLVSGWNFVGINQELFSILNNPASLKLSDVSGDCRIISAYFFGAGTNPSDTSQLNMWVPINLGDSIPIANINRGIVVKVDAGCSLALVGSPNKICTITGNKNDFGTSDLYSNEIVTLKDSNGNVIDSKTDSCESTTISYSGHPVTLIHKYRCDYYSNSPTAGANIYALNFEAYQGGSYCSSCVDGACIK